MTQTPALKSLILNILSVASVGAFDFFILPLLDPRHEKFVHRHFGALYQAFWLAPLVTISLWLNVSTQQRTQSDPQC